MTGFDWIEKAFGRIERNMGMFFVFACLAAVAWVGFLVWAIFSIVTAVVAYLGAV